LTKVSQIYLYARRCFSIFYFLGLRIEWAKSRARALRWGEDVKLIDEEMRRVLVSLDWKAAWWIDRGTACKGLDPPMTEGLVAYAAKQAQVQRDLAKSFADQWYPALAGYEIVPQWPSKYMLNRDSELPADAPSLAVLSDETAYDDDEDITMYDELFE
jgi:hypothetical protein